MEEKYWELREAVDRAFDNYMREPNAYFKFEYDAAYQRYVEFCTEVLEELMDENPDVLKRLKEC